MGRMKSSLTGIHLKMGMHYKTVWETDAQQQLTEISIILLVDGNL